MHIIFLNGREFRGTWREFKRALWHPLFIGQVLGVAGIILLVQPYDDIMPAGAMMRVLIVASAIAVFLWAAVFGFSRFAIAKRRARTLVVMLPAIAVASVWGVILSVLLGGNALTLLGWVELIAFNFIFAILVEIFLASFLLRRIMVETGLKAYPIAGISPSLLQPLPEERAVPTAQIGPAAARPLDTDAPFTQAANDETAPQHIRILDKSFALDAVWHLKAEEHYVSLTLRDGTSFLLRGRLADAIEQVSPRMGLQVHRSHWVAMSALAELDRKRNGWRLRLRNGTDIPVARNRQSEVRNWVEAALQAA